MRLHSAHLLLRHLALASVLLACDDEPARSCPRTGRAVLWRISGSITLDGEVLVLGERYDAPVGGFVECNARNFLQGELQRVRPALELFGEYSVHIDCEDEVGRSDSITIEVPPGYWPGEAVPGEVRLFPPDDFDGHADATAGVMTCMGSRVYEEPIMMRELVRQGGFYNPGADPTEWAISDPLRNERQLTVTVARRPGQEEPDGDCVGPRDTLSLDLLLVATEETVEVVQNECLAEE